MLLSYDNMSLIDPFVAKMYSLSGANTESLVG
jgi:hypothetical protein